VSSSSFTTHKGTMFLTNLVQVRSQHASVAFAEVVLVVTQNQGDRAEVA
jgi:hypothetical protein